MMNIVFFIFETTEISEDTFRGRFTLCTVKIPYETYPDDNEVRSRNSNSNDDYDQHIVRWIREILIVNIEY